MNITKICCIGAGYVGGSSMTIVTEIKTVFLTFAEAKSATSFLVSSSKFLSSLFK